MSEFLDAQSKHNEHPDTFWVPSQKELDEIVESQYVKICENHERFWVKITEVDGEKLIGRVDNDLVNEHSFKCDDLVEFEKRNIMNILNED